MPTAPTCWPMRSPPHGGRVMWRAFVYSHEQPDDRAKQAYDEFVPLDGRFRDNVLVQVKNGADRFPAARTVPSAVRRDAEDAADDGVPDHQGIPRLRHAPGLSRAAVRGDPAADTHAQGARLDRGAGHRRHPRWARPDRHGRRRQHRHRPQLVRLAVRPGQLVRVRPPGMESDTSHARAIARRLDANDILERRRRRRDRSSA